MFMAPPVVEVAESPEVIAEDPRLMPVAPPLTVFGLRPCSVIAPVVVLTFELLRFRAVANEVVAPDVVPSMSTAPLSVVTGY